jgi:WD40 repeat protein
LRFSSDGRRLLIVGGGDVDVRKVGDGRTVLKASVSHLASDVRDVAFSPDGRRLAIAFGGVGVDDARGVSLRDLAGATEVGKSINFLDGSKDLGDETDDTAAFSVEFSPDGRYLASAATNKDFTGCQLKLWDSATRQKVHTFPGHALGAVKVVFSPDGKRLASAGVDEAVKVWDVATGEELYSFAGFVSDDYDDPSPLAFSPPDGKLLATARGADVTVWDLTTGQRAFGLRGHEGTVGNLVFGADGKSLVSIGQGELRVWEVPASWVTPEAQPAAATTQRLR